MSGLFGEGVVVLVVGVAVVFSVLIILMTVTYLFGVFFKKDSDERHIKEEVVTSSDNGIKTPSELKFRPGFDTEDGELIAVISAAISSYVGTGSGSLKIRSIKKVN